MSTTPTAIERNKRRRIRGAILQFVCDNHYAQRPHMDDVSLWGVLMDLQFPVEGQNEVISLLQDLSERGYLSFTEKKNRVNGRTEISRIAITPAGRDLVDHSKEDLAVLIP
jgi:hypothetical protein